MTPDGNEYMLDFKRGINAEVIERAAGADDSEGGDFQENAFTQLMIEYLSEAGVAEDGQVCYVDKTLAPSLKSVRSNGYFISEEEGRVDFFYSIFTGSDSIEPLHAPEAIEAVSQCIRLYALAQSGEFRAFEESSEAYDMLSEIHEHRDLLKRLRILLLTDKSLPKVSREALARRIREIRVKGGISFRLEVVDLTRLQRIVQAGAEHEPIQIDLRRDAGAPLPCVMAKDVNPAYDVYLAIIPGEVLHNLYDEYGSRLLELNVRAFLQVNGKVNRGIRETLKTEPSMFLPYNNGISATADQVETERLKDGTLAISKMTGLQVVNGGQTMASIHRARKTDKSNISDVLVQAKITVVRRKKDLDVEDLVHKISLYANSQNKVNEADFSANDPFHVRLEQLGNTIYVPGHQSRWFYERARGSYQTAKHRHGTTSAKRKDFDRLLPASQKFTKTDFAKYSASWEQMPHFVSLGGQKNFVRCMDQIKKAHSKTWEPDETYYRHLVSQAIIFKAVEREARAEGFPGYRANIVTYTVALLAHHSGGDLNLDLIWMKQGISEELTDALREWTHLVYERILRSAAGRNVTEWCKKEQCWAEVRSLGVAVTNGTPELATGASLVTAEDDDESSSAPKDGVRRATGPTPSDLLNMARIMGYSAKTWRKIAQWGVASGDLTEAQIKLTMKLTEAADDDWEDTPTPSVAKRAQHVLDAASKAIDLDSDQAISDEDWISLGS